MKVAVVNFSGNTGKTTVSDSLLSPRMGGVRFAIETINAGASDDAAEIERMKGRQFGELSEILLTEDNAVVDVGASNVEDFFKYMGQFAGSHEDFDYFLVPTVSEKKQQADTINTIKTLAALACHAAAFWWCSTRLKLMTLTTCLIRSPLCWGSMRWRRNSRSSVMR